MCKYICDFFTYEFTDLIGANHKYIGMHVSEGIRVFGLKKFDLDYRQVKETIANNRKYSNGWKA